MILIDSCCWMEYFDRQDPILDQIIELRLAATCGVINLEIIPFLHDYQSSSLEAAFLDIPELDLTIAHDEWISLGEDQKYVKKYRLNGIGIADLMILHTAKTHGVKLYTIDNTLKKAASILKIPLYEHS